MKRQSKRLFQAPMCSSGVVIIEDKDDETFSCIAGFHMMLQCPTYSSVSLTVVDKTSFKKNV